MVMGEMSREADLVVIGAGPGGYAAAFRAAELGLDTVLVDERPKPGGVCLYEGCIPSKTLLSVTQLISKAKDAKKFGVSFGKPEIDLSGLRNWKNQVIEKLTGGLSLLTEKRGIEYIQGRAVFENSKTLRIEATPSSRVTFKHAIIATGSRPIPLSGIDIQSKYFLDSSSALRLESIPASLLVVGGGYIGLELGLVYAELGSEVTIVELTGSLLPGVDPDLVRPLARKVEQKVKKVYVNAKVTAIKEQKEGLKVTFEGSADLKEGTFEKVLVAIGRKPNTETIGLENTKVKRNEKGFIEVDGQCRTSEKHIFAIGDVGRSPMLAHKATREGRIAAEVISGMVSSFDNRAIPAVVFTNPEVAWSGLMEKEAKEAGYKTKITRFPWGASGRALSVGNEEGLTKLVFDETNGVLLGIGIVGAGAGELIAEGTLALEMGALAEDLAATIHAHPTLSETLMEAAELFFGASTHLYKK